MQRMLGFYWTPSGDNDEIARQCDLIAGCGANTVVVPHSALDHAPLDRLRSANIQLCVDWTIFAGEALRQTFPDTIPVDADGAAFERDEWYLPSCPNHPQVRAWHLQAMQAVLARYGDAMSGLWLDFIRYPVRWERDRPHLRELCFCPTCLNLFLGEQRAHYGIDETRRLASQILQERRAEWVEWKCSRIVAFVEAVRAQISASGHAIRLGMFSLPWTRTDWDGALRAIAAQDLPRLAQVVDVISPMVYHQLCRRPAEWIPHVVDDASDSIQRPVLPVIQSIDQPRTMPAAELDAALDEALAAQGSLGALIFTLAPLLESPDKVDVVRRHFSGAG